MNQDQLRLLLEQVRSGSVEIDSALDRLRHMPFEDLGFAKGASGDGAGFKAGCSTGFGGGGANGKRSLEGTFLPGCILTGRAAARHITSAA